MKSIDAIDVAEKLIKYIAKNKSYQEKIENIDFKVASVLDLLKLYSCHNFDCIISQRCLINLPNWKLQKNAIKEVYDLLDNHGIFLLTEGFQDGLDKLNIIRKKVGLDEIKVVKYNKNLQKDKFENYVSKYFDILEVKDYGAYIFLSRIFHPLEVYPENPKHDSHLNETAMKISQSIEMKNFEEYSYNLFYVLKKKK